MLSVFGRRPIIGQCGVLRGRCLISLRGGNRRPARVGGRRGVGPALPRTEYGTAVLRYITVSRIRGTRGEDEMGSISEGEPLAEQIEFVVIGTGQVGLAISYYLTQSGVATWCWNKPSTSRLPGGTADGTPSLLRSLTCRSSCQDFRIRVTSPMAFATGALRRAAECLDLQ